MPMPRAADKAVRIERAHVVVVFTLRLDGAPQPELPEGPIAHAPEAVPRMVVDRAGALTTPAALRQWLTVSAVHIPAL